MSEEHLNQEADVDDLSDEDFAKLKASMRDEPVVQEPAKAESEKEPAKAAQEPEKQEMVPHGQFHRANERRKEAEARADLALQRLSELLQASQRPQQQEQPKAQEVIPSADPQDPNFDPIARLAYQDKQIRDLTERLSGRETQERQQIEGQQAFNAAYQAVRSRFSQRATEQPELNEAYSYTLASFAREFAANGTPGMMADGSVIPGSDLDNALKKHEAQVISYCYSQNIPIEDYLLSVATARGWQKPNGKTAEVNGEQRRNADGTFAKAEGERIDKLEETKQKAKSLGGSGAPVEMADLTPQMVVDMTDEEFAAFKTKYGESALRRVMA